MRREAIKQMVASHGGEGFVRMFIEMLGEKKFKPEDVSLKGLWEGLVGPVEETLQQGRQAGGKLSYMLPRGFGRKEAVTSSLFPIALGAMIAAKGIEGYNEQPYIGEQLVTTFDSKMKVDTIPGFTALDGPLEVDEGEEYEDSSFGEKFVTLEARKRGRILSVTEEAIIFDQSGQILMKAKGLGGRMKLDKETRILKGVIDILNTVYKPSNVAEALYSAGHGNLVVSNAMVDWQNIDTCLRQAAQMTDEKGNPIAVNLSQLLIPRALWATAMRITNATMVRNQSATADPQMATYSSSPFAGQFSPITSPILDGFSTSTWYMGDFKRTFWYKQIFPLQTLAANPGSEDEFERDIKFRFKMREYGDVGAVDFRHVFKNIAAAS